MRFPGKVVVITGGDSGIGAACADRFLDEGARVVSLDQHGRPPCDVADEASVRAAFERIAGQHKRVDILFNNAGISIRKTAQDHTLEEWDRIFAVNVRGMFLCSRYALPLMSQGGCIIHSSSVVGITGVRNRAAYSASKGAVVALTRNMALDYAPRGIRVNAVAPGFIDTPLLAPLHKEPVRLAAITAMHPLGRLGAVEDVASAVVFLASGEASWITGVTLPVDGGFSAGHQHDV
jgi:NAD(P)-dependent dehydrogenase (short-subunit alcohol dehydrogenase family)